MPTEEELRQRIQNAIREHERLVGVWKRAVERAKTGAPGARHAEQNAAHAADKASRKADEAVEELFKHSREKHGY